MSIKSVPQVGDQLRITQNSDPSLCTPGETVTVVKVETYRGGIYLHVDGRREFRRFYWSEVQQ